MRPGGWEERMEGVQIICERVGGTVWLKMYEVQSI